MEAGDLGYWMIFLGAALALNLSPGPDLIYVLSRTLAQGKKAGLASAAGVCTGAMVHVMAAAFGLSAILATSAMAFTVVKYAGAAYLLYLGVQALRSGGAAQALRTPAPEAAASGWQAFRQGVLIDVLNPKVALFFMAFLPQFVRPGHGATSVQLVVLGALVILVAIAVEAALVLAADRTAGFFRENPRASVWLDRVFGTVLIGLGIRLALSSQRN